MTDEEKQLYMKYCKYDKEPKEVIIDLLNLIEKQQRKIKIKDEYLELIHDIIVDYDGCNTVESLKSLIDETDDLIEKASKCDDKSIMFTGAKGGKFNVLHERIEE